MEGACRLENVIPFCEQLMRTEDIDSIKRRTGTEKSAMEEKGVLQDIWDDYKLMGKDIKEFFKPLRTDIWGSVGISCVQFC